MLAQLVPAWLLGLLLGLGLFGRGLVSYRRAARVRTIASSPLRGLAAGEVRVSGSVEPGTTLLVSPLQSQHCVHYHARVTVSRDRSTEVLLDRDRSVSFVLRDATGSVRVFPRGARWDLEPRIDERTGLFDGAPPALDINDGSDMEAATVDREAQIARLLTVRGAPDPDSSLFERTMGGYAGGSSGASDSGGIPGGALGEALAGDAGPLGGGTRYREERVEPGDVVTIVATALPYAGLAGGADDPDVDPMADPEVAADLAAASASGALRARAEDAWGNAAIPGFGIGRPQRAPVLDPEATPEPAISGPDAAARSTMASVSGTVSASSPAPASTIRPPGAAARSGTTWMDIGPDELVLASGSTPMIVMAGTPAEAVGRDAAAFWQGMAGAVLAVACAALLVMGLAAR